MMNFFKHIIQKNQLFQSTITLLGFYGEITFKIIIPNLVRVSV
jgi:hypothetical protein